MEGDYVKFNGKVLATGFSASVALGCGIAAIFIAGFVLGMLV